MSKRANYVDVVITDYGSFPIKPCITDAYKRFYGKKRAGKLTKKSEAAAYGKLNADIGAVSKLYWILGKAGLPAELLAKLK